MKLLYSTLIFFLLGVSAYCQDPADMQALKEAVGAEKYNYMASHDPERLNGLAYANRHGYYIAPVENKADLNELPDALLVESNYPGAPDINIQMLETGSMNRVLYNFTIPEDGVKLYRIGNTPDKVLVIMSPTVINLHKSYNYK